MKSKLLACVLGGGGKYLKYWTFSQSSERRRDSGFGSGINRMFLGKEHVITGQDALQIPPSLYVGHHWMKRSFVPNSPHRIQKTRNHEESTLS